MPVATQPCHHTPLTRERADTTSPGECLVQELKEHAVVTAGRLNTTDINTRAAIAILGSPCAHCACACIFMRGVTCDVSC